MPGPAPAPEPAATRSARARRKAKTSEPPEPCLLSCPSPGCSSTCRWPTSTGPSTTWCPRRCTTRSRPGTRVKVRFAGQDVDGLRARPGGEQRPRRPARARCVARSAPSRCCLPAVARLTGLVAARYAGTRSDVLRLAVPSGTPPPSSGSRHRPRRHPSPRRRRDAGAPTQHGVGFVRALGAGRATARGLGRARRRGLAAPARRGRRRHAAHPAAGRCSASPTARTSPGSTRR